MSWKKKKQAPVLYEKYLEDQKEQKEREKISEELEVPEEKIVVAQISTGSRILELFGAGLKTALRILGILAVFILASIGLTVLCNSYLRTTFFDAIAATFF